MFKVILMLILFVLCPATWSENQQRMDTQSTKVCWPLHFAGIVVGVTNESQVRLLLGNGHQVKGEGSTGGLYYVDRQRKMSLHTVQYADGVVGELSISREEINLNKPAEFFDHALSDNLNVNEGFGKWHQLKLGSTKQDVVLNLGKPAKEEGESVWRYDTSCSCEIQNYFIIHFSDDKIDRVVFFAPQG